MENNIKNVLVPLVRHALTAAGAWFGVTGLTGDSTVEALAGAFAVIIGLAWSILEKKNAQVTN